METLPDGSRRVTTVDGLFKPGQRESTWPEEFFTSRSSTYAVELNGRGIDNYVWLEGYIVRGPNAGTLMRAAVPYLPGRGQASVEKVFPRPRSGRAGGK